MDIATPDVARRHATLSNLIALRNSVERAALCLYSVDGSGLIARDDRVADPFLCFTVQNHLQILLSSFLEEWPRFSAVAKDDLDVRETLRQVKPAIDRLKSWQDLPSVRSKLLAHPYRDKNGDPVLAWDVLRESKSPTTLGETLLLAFCVCMAVDRIKARHAAEVSEADGRLLRLDRTYPSKGIATAQELEEELQKKQAQLKATTQPPVDELKEE